MSPHPLCPAAAAALSRLVQGGRGRRARLALLGGLLVTAALPPWHLWPLLPVGLGLLLLLTETAVTAPRAFGIAWLWGLAHFSAGDIWLANALLIEADKFAWMIPFAIFGLGGVLALFPATAALLACRCSPAGLPRLLLFAAGWSLMEMARGWVLTGFAWNPLATVALPCLPLAQFAALGGAYGLSWLVVLLGGAPLLLVSGPGRLARAGLAGIGLLALLVLGWGNWRIPAGPSPLWPDLTLRLVQGNIDQASKWNPQLRRQHLADYLRLSQTPAEKMPNLILWPETAVPYLLEEDSPLRKIIGIAAPKNGFIITGLLRTLTEDGRYTHIWNSLEAIAPDGSVSARYDKIHLVPFGEYVPFSSFPPLRQLVGMSVDISAGTLSQNLLMSKIPEVGPSVCYEDIFPGEVRDPHRRPQWLLNVTNDGWFGMGIGPQQHFAAARFRALEEGVPLVRVANTGVSAVVDAYGRVVMELPVAVQAIGDTGLPLPSEETYPFALLGKVCNFVIIFTSSGLSLLLGRMRPTQVG